MFALGPELQTDLTYLLRIIISMILGGFIGLEREMAEKPAGLRTHVLVAGSATLLVILADLIISQFQAQEASNLIQSDPIRIFEAIMVGISFLGAGTIWQSEKGKKIEGLTTAASLFFTGALGIAVALEKYLLAIASGLILLGVSSLLK